MSESLILTFCIKNHILKYFWIQGLKNLAPLSLEAKILVACKSYVTGLRANILF